LHDMTEIQDLVNTMIFHGKRHRDYKLYGICISWNSSGHVMNQGVSGWTVWNEFRGYLMKNMIFTYSQDPKQPVLDSFLVYHPRHFMFETVADLLDVLMIWVIRDSCQGGGG
jgi:hypothetical protein